MKVKVLKKFRDKKENIIRRKNAIFECSEERYEEICATNKNLVAVVEESEETSEEPDETVEESDELKEDEKGSGSVCDIAHMTEGQLRDLAKEKKIKGYTKMSLEQLKDALK